MIASGEDSRASSVPSGRRGLTSVVLRSGKRYGNVEAGRGPSEEVNKSMSGYFAVEAS